MPVSLLENSLKVDIFFEESDQDFEDDICISIREDCPDEEKIFRADETNIFVTPDQACLLVLALQRALENYRSSCQEP
ncbi:MAG: hypothetical protein GWP61_13880 [Chloroflexi bacterium]|jgi:hypothetical protein|nr:hypothetical protein [Chloroflexota bacterium]